MPAQRHKPPTFGVFCLGDLVIRTTDERAARAKVENESRSGPLGGWSYTRICAYVHCHARLDGLHESARFHDPKCKAAQWKLDTGYGRPARRERRTNAGPPPLVGVKIDRELNEAIKPFAERAGISVREWVTRWIVRGLADEL